jgi:hypothetical protein
MSANIGEIMGEEKRKLLLNGVQVPREVLNKGYDELVGDIVFIEQYTEVERDLGLGRLLQIAPTGICKFQRKDGSSFKVDIRDIKSMKRFISKDNYRGNRST